MTVVSMNYLLEAGVHFGHQTKRWNPKMKEYIFTSRDDIYIIDLQKTAKKIEEAYIALNRIAANGGKVLFVGTRKQASDATKEEALRSNSYYVTERWLGGTLTNFRTIRKRVKRLEEIEKMEKDGTFDVLPKKEVIGLKKQYEKLNKVLSGIRDMYKLPEAIFIVDPSKETIAILEARRLNIPVFGIVDTNCDPDMVDYVIPGNDDAIRAVKLIIGVMANAIVEANGGKTIDFVNEEDKQKGDNPKDIMQKALETVKKKEDRPRSYNDNQNNRPYQRNEHNDNRRYNNNDNRNEPRADFRVEPKVEPKAEIKVEPKVEPVVEVKVTAAPVVKEEVVVKEKAKKEDKQDLSKLTVAELREMVKEKDVKGYSTMKKAELIDALK